MSAPQPPAVADRRRQDIIRAGFDQIAQAGFEGLRMRDVAARAGVNISTVHYYLTTKESLIRAVAVFAVERIRGTMPDEGSTEDRLRGYLRGVCSTFISDPSLRQVLGEILVRAHRDPDVAGILADVNEQWFATTKELISELPARSATPEPSDAASATIMMLQGAAILPFDKTRIEAAFHQLETWLLGSSS